MTKWSTPPIAKVYEALSAIADDRVKITGETAASVVSSAGDKTYVVRWSPDYSKLSSTDNASRWQGYAGYPIVAVLLVLGRIRYDTGLAGLLAGVPWNSLNKQYKREYDRAIDHVLEQVDQAGGDVEALRGEASRILAELAALEIEQLGR